jgi:diacylglycerol kinase family enzyme
VTSVKYVLVFNQHARRYSQEAEAAIVAQAAALLPEARLTVTHTVPQTDGHEVRYAIQNFVHCSQDADCVVAVGGDGTINLVVSALMRSGLATHVPLGVIPYGTGNNLVRSYGLERDSDKALLTIRQGHTVNLDIGLINQQYYFINASFGAFSYLAARRVTKSLVGWTYDALRHMDFIPWPVRLRYTDTAGRVVELPAQRYLVGAFLNTSHYGSILHMAPDAIGDDGLFDVKLVSEVPRLAYPLIFTVILTGQYDLSRHTTTFRARRVDVLPETACPFETDGDPIPLQPQYTVEVAGQLRLIVPSSPSRPGLPLPGRKG